MVRACCSSQVPATSSSWPASQAPARRRWPPRSRARSTATPCARRGRPAWRRSRIRCGGRWRTPGTGSRCGARSGEPTAWSSYGRSPPVGCGAPCCAAHAATIAPSIFSSSTRRLSRRGRASTRAAAGSASGRCAGTSAAGPARTSRTKAGRRCCASRAARTPSGSSGRSRRIRERRAEHGSTPHAHVKTSDGTLKVVLVNASFGGHGGPGRPGPRRPRAPRRPGRSRPRRDRADR